MPIGFISEVFENGLPDSPRLNTSLKILSWILLLVLLKRYFGGASTSAERNMHSKVIMMTGGTSGIGASIAYSLAKRGAQLVLLTQYPLSDPFLASYIEDLRDSTGNELITAEQVDLNSLHSIRKFATKWTDNLPVRRLDALVLLASTQSPKGADVTISEEGVETMFQVNYLANFQLLGLISPALRAQPADRDVRVVIGNCSSYMNGEMPQSVPVPILPSALSTKSKNKKTRTPSGIPKAANPSKAYGSAKLALLTFSNAFQKHLAAYERPDKNPAVARVLCVDPGFSRTPGMQRALTNGSLWGLLFYLLTWPMWWLVLKSAPQGAESFLYAIMEEKFAKGTGWHNIKECKEVGVGDKEVIVKSEEEQKRLWEMSDKAVEALERQAAQKRAVQKKEDEEKRKDDERRAQKERDAEKKDGSRRSRKADKT
ncbi:MAG: hypothetical protein Q9162_001937 [Coniocarpon cinnabarinum]